MTLKQNLSGIALAVSTALAAPAYTAPPTMESGRFVPAKKGAKQPTRSTKSRPTLEKRLQSYRAETAQQVQDLNDKYATVQKTVYELTSPENTYFMNILKQALGEKFTQLTGLKNSRDTNCQTAVDNYVSLARDLTQTYDEVDAILTGIEAINQDKTWNSSAKAEMMRILFNNLTLEEYTDEFLAYVNDKLNEKNVTEQYSACKQVSTTYTGALDDFLNLFQSNVYETEEQKRTRIERVIQAKVPGMFPKSRVGLSALVGGAYSPKNGFEGSVGAEVVYYFLPRFTIAANGSLVLSSPEDQTTTTEPSTSTTAVGPGYQQQSNVVGSTTSLFSKHYDLGARIAIELLRSGNFSLHAGASAHVYGGEETNITSRTRTSQLQNAKGNNLGTAHSVSDQRETKQDVRSFVPAGDLEACQKDLICLRLGGAYDTLYKGGIWFAYLVGRFF